MRSEEAEHGNATESHLRKVLSDVSERANQNRLEYKTADTFLKDWLGRAQKMKSAGTHERYRNVVDDFLKSLESKAKAKLSDITVRDVQKFIEKRLGGGLNPSTVRTDCKILNAPFALALRQGLTLSNPVAAAEIPEGIKESRSPFSADQVTELLKACDRLTNEDAENAAVWKEWKTCVLIGFFTGARLGDAVAMNLTSFDFDRHVLKLRPQQTSRKKRDLIIPLHPQLEAYVLDLPIQDKQGALFPTLARRKVSGNYGLSIQFHRILAESDIEQETVKAAGKAGHKFHKYAFHSLRYSFVSEMANVSTQKQCIHLGRLQEKRRAEATGSLGEREMDTWLLEIWPLVKEYGWNYCQLWQVANHKWESLSDDDALASVTKLEERCKKMLKLRFGWAGRAKSGRPRTIAEGGKATLPSLASSAIGLQSKAVVRRSYNCAWWILEGFYRSDNFHSRPAHLSRCSQDES